MFRSQPPQFFGGPIFFWFEVNREKQLEYSQGPLLCDMGRFLNISESLLLYKGWKMRTVQLSGSYEKRKAQSLLQNKESISFALMMMLFSEGTLLQLQKVQISPFFL